VEFDVVVVGSGFGGSVAALRAAEKGYRVCVLEAGRRFGPDDFPRTSWDLRRFLYAPRLGLHGIQRLTLLRRALVLSGAGVGGGSLVYANVLHEPLEPFFRDAQWVGITDWRRELSPWYEVVRRMLGAATVPFATPADEVVREVARRMGVEDTFRPTQVAVDFDKCVRCGGCMVGCRYEAKNTLDRTYLRRAEELGAEIRPENEATRIRRGSDGRWRVDTRNGTFAADQVVLAAGALGTLKLLFRSGLGGPRVGALVRTNSESVLGASAPGTRVDYSNGIAIGSSFNPAPDTQIQPVRYPRGSNSMGLLGTLLVDGGGRVPRPLRWLGEVARHPLRAALGVWVRGWSERTVILLVMQARDNSLRLRWNGRRLKVAEGTTPSWISAGNEAARHAAEAMGGFPGSSLNEVLLGAPITAHVLGGAVIGATPDEGVIDAYHRVYSEPGLYVVDGAAVSANPGTNPALTIAAQAERALSFWPRKGEPDPRPPLGEPYRVLLSGRALEGTLVEHPAAL
jgi:cholesterol oxidase